MWGFLFFVLTTLWLRHEALPLFSSHIIGGVEGDIGIYLYIMRLIPEHGYFFPRWFDLPIIYPHGSVLAWSDNFLLPAHISYFFRVVGLSFVESLNLLSLIITFLNGYVTFLYCKQKPLNFFVGFAVQSLPFLALHLGHPQLQAVFIFPLALILLEKRKSFSLGLLLTGTFLYGVYLFFYLALLLAIVGFKELKDFKFVLRGLLGISLIIPFLLPYLFLESRELFEGYEFRATPLSYLFNTHPEAAHFPGIAVGLVLLLTLGQSLGFLGSLNLILWLFLIEKGFLVATFFIPLTVFFVKEKKSLWLSLMLFLALSFGSAPNTISLHSVLSELVPGLISLRASGRMGLVFTLLLLLLAEKNFLLRSWKVVLGLISGLFVETRFQSIPLEPYPYTQVKEEEIAIVLPYAGDLTQDGRIKSYREFAKLNMSVVHEFFGATLVNGYSGLQGGLTERLAKLFSSFPDSARIAKSIAGLSFIYSKDKVDVSWLREVGKFGDYNKYEILDVEFPGKGTFLVHPSKDSLSVVWKADKECSVLVNGQEIKLNRNFTKSNLKLISHRGSEPTRVYFEGCDIITVRSVS